MAKKKQVLCPILVHGHQSLRTISQKTNNSILRKLSEGRTDGREQKQR